MSSFENVQLEQFKQAIAEFCKAAESGTLEQEQLDSGIKAASLLYFGLPTPEEDPAGNAIAVSYLEYAMRRHTDATMNLTMKERQDATQN